MDLEGKVGLRGNPAANNTGGQIALGQLLDILTRESLVEDCRLGNVYSACNSAAVTFGTALPATGVTFHLHNPSGSNVNLELVHAAVNIVTCTVSGTIVYALNSLSTAAAPATTTAITVVSNLLGDTSTGAGRAYSVATLPSVPVQGRILAGAIATPANVAPTAVHDNPRGSIIIGPGCVLSFQGITIAGTGLFSAQWREVQIS